MKRWAIVSGAAVLLLVGAGVALARADVRGWRGCFPHGGARFGPMGYMARELELNDSQRKQIRGLWQAERPAVFGLVREFAEESREMDGATANGNLDESNMQEIAARQGATVAKLLVEKERLRAKIYTAVLSPEQRTKADAMQARWHERLERLGNRAGR